MHHCIVGSLHVHDAQSLCHLVDTDERIEIGRSRAHGDERIHVGRKMEERLEAHLEVASVHKEHERRKKELRHRACHHPFHASKARNLRPAEHGAHCDIEERHAEHKRPDELLLLRGNRLVCRDLGIDEGSCLLGCVCTGARGSAVACLVDSGNDRIERLRLSVVDELHRILQQVDLGLAHAFDA